MKIPHKKETMLSEDCWFAGMAIALYSGGKKPREGFEIAIRKYAAQLAANDPSFTTLLENIKTQHKQNL